MPRATKEEEVRVVKRVLLGPRGSLPFLTESSIFCVKRCNILTRDHFADEKFATVSGFGKRRRDRFDS